MAPLLIGIDHHPSVFVRNVLSLFVSSRFSIFFCWICGARRCLLWVFYGHHWSSLGTSRSNIQTRPSPLLPSPMLPASILLFPIYTRRSCYWNLPTLWERNALRWVSLISPLPLLRTNTSSYSPSIKSLLNQALPRPMHPFPLPSLLRPNSWEFITPDRSIPMLRRLLLNPQVQPSRCPLNHYVSTPRSLWSN